MKKARKRCCSLFLALVMTLSLAVMPATAAEENAAPGEATLSLDRATLSLAESGQEFTATLTVKPGEAAAKWTQEEWTAWAKELDWYLDRDAKDSPQDPELYPHVYTGDALTAWQSWGTDGTDGKDYFTVAEPVVALSDGVAAVTQKFTTGTFMLTEDGDNFYQKSSSYGAPGSMMGLYELSARDGGKTMASTLLDVTLYESYTYYSELYDTLQEIKALAEKKGRYFDIQIYGYTETGTPQYNVVVSDSAKSVTSFKKMNETALTDPASLIRQIAAGKLDYRVPVMFNNVHPNECPPMDAQINLMRQLATEDTITYNTISGLMGGKKVDMSQYDPKLVDITVGDYAFTGYGQKISGDATGNNDGFTDASKYYTFSDDQKLDVDALLDNLILVFSPTENPDGRTYNTRATRDGYDLNRDCTNQVQLETQNLSRLINEWNPVVFAEFHGFLNEFLVEPCTPPHEPNMEYDILVENFLLGAEAFGNSALATMSVQHKDEFYYKFQSYYTPLRDDYDPKTGWSAWDDLCTNYGPSYAMLNCGSMGYTIETPCNNEACTRLLEAGSYGFLEYIKDNKDNIYTNQLTFFQRGLENIDARAEMQHWYVDQQNKELPADTWRRPLENDNYFPEYWVIPVDASLQRDPADAWVMGEFLTHNGVKVSQLTKDVTVGGKTYKAGDLVVDMYQAKRNYANAVLWEGADASNSGFPDLYSESVSNFPAMRGFDCDAVTAKGAFDGALKAIASFDGQSQFSGVPGKAVVIANGGQESIQAVNALLDAKKAVGLVTEGAYKGDFVTSYADYKTVDGKFVLVGTGVDAMPTAYAIEKPTLYLTGRYEDFSGYQVTEGYYAEWFQDGYGFYDTRNVQSNGTSNYDLVAYTKHLGFTITADPAKADVIVGSVPLNQAEQGAAAVAAVKGGTPYVATGAGPLEFIKTDLLPGQFDYEKLGMESLHYVTYPTDSLSTASYVNDKDDVLYTYNCAAITKVPTGAGVLIQAADKDSHIAGCCLTADGRALDGKVEAIALKPGGMDLTIFANSVANRAHQQDDYRYAANTIYAKSLSAAPMTIAGVDGAVEAPASGFTDVPADYWATESIDYAVANGLFNGTSANTFSPAMSMDRAMLVTVLYRMADSPEAPAPAPGFADVPAGTWYTDAVNWAVKEGVASGTGSGFAPTSAVTREQIAVFLYNYAKAQGATPSSGDKLGSFQDANTVSTWAASAMDWATEQGFFTGKDGNRLDPAGTASRAEVATILMRFLER